jgi:hypothetical protein
LATGTQTSDGTAVHVGVRRLASAMVAPALVVTALVSIAVISLDAPGKVFRSPDEHASYVFTMLLADTGSLHYTKDYLVLDEENLLHPRGALTYQERAVPFNYLGIHLLYAPVYRVLEENTRYVAIPIAVATIVALAMAGSLLIPHQRSVAWVAVLGVTPVIYYLNRPFFNVVPALMFLSFGFLFILLYLRSSGRKHLVGAAVCLAFAALMRYELAIFATLFVGLVIFQRHGAVRWNAALDIAAFAAVMTLLFLVPVLALNTIVYGSPFTYGYGLFNEVYFPERTGHGGFPLGVLRSLRSVLLPAYPLDFKLAVGSFVRQVIGVAPIFTVVVGLGVFSAVKNRVVPLRFLIGYGVLALYLFLYRGAGYSWLADSKTPHLEASIVRYALPLYAAAYLLAVYGLAQIRRSDVALAVVGILVVASLSGALRDIDGNLLHIRNQLRQGHELTLSGVVPNTEANAIIYTDVFDKLFGPYREVAAWWGGERGLVEGFFRPDEISRSMSRVLEARPVYLFVHREDVILPEMRTALASRGLQLVETGLKRLHKVVPINAAIDAGPKDGD